MSRIDQDLEAASRGSSGLEAAGRGSSGLEAASRGSSGLDEVDGRNKSRATSSERFLFNLYNKVTGCLSVYKKNTRQIWFFFTVKLLKGPEKVYNTYKGR